MKKFVVPFAGLLLVAGAAHAQEADHADHADHGPDPAAEPAETALPPAEVGVTAAAEVSDAEIDSFAKATVALQAISADTTLEADAKQQAMVAAVAEAGLEPAQYNAIGRAAQADATLRAKVQTAMSRYVGPGEG